MSRWGKPYTKKRHHQPHRPVTALPAGSAAPVAVVTHYTSCEAVCLCPYCGYTHRHPILSRDQHKFCTRVDKCDEVGYLVKGREHE